MLAVAALLLAVSVVLVASAASPPRPMTYACASDLYKLKDVLRYVSGPSRCTRAGETLVTFAERSPVYVCRKERGTPPEARRSRFGFAKGIRAHGPVGLIRMVDAPGNCRPAAQPNEIPVSLPAIKRVLFCAAKRGGELRWVTKARQCDKKEFPVVLAKRSVEGNGVANNGNVVANPDTAAIDADTVKSIDLVANDTAAGPGNKKLSVASTDTAGTQSTVTLNPDGTVAYDPNGRFKSLKPGDTATDTFKYRATDGPHTSDPATATVTITGVNDAPVAVADSKTVGEDSGATSIDVLANDTDVDGWPKSVQSKTNGTHGAVAITGGGTEVTYAPDADFCGSDSFTYTLNDGSTATVSVTVSCSNDAPVVDLNSGGTAGFDTIASFTEDSPAASVAPNADLSDVDDDNLESAKITLTNRPDTTAESLSVTTTGTLVSASIYDNSSGEITLSGSRPKSEYQMVIRSLTYDNSSNTPDTTDRVVDVNVNDGALDSNVAHSTVSVADHDDAPTATDQSGLTTNEDTTLPIILSGTDPENDPLTFTHDSASGHGGTITGPTASVDYTPAAGYCGPDSFSFTVDDGNGGTDQGTISITVNC